MAEVRGVMQARKTGYAGRDANDRVEQRQAENLFADWRGMKSRGPKWLLRSQWRSRWCDDFAFQAETKLFLLAEDRPVISRRSSR